VTIREAKCRSASTNSPSQHRTQPLQPPNTPRVLGPTERLWNLAQWTKLYLFVVIFCKRCIGSVTGIERRCTTVMTGDTWFGSACEAGVMTGDASSSALGTVYRVLIAPLS
jgi:hypothetical protein